LGVGRIHVRAALCTYAAFGQPSLITSVSSSPPMIYSVAACTHCNHSWTYFTIIINLRSSRVSSSKYFIQYRNKNCPVISSFTIHSHTKYFSTKACLYLTEPIIAFGGC
jgi:hypothetical protein